MNVFDAKLFAAVAYAMSHEETRYYLNGVYLEGNLAVATNGHLLTVAYDDAALIEEPGIYPVSKASHSAAKSIPSTQVRIDGGILEVVDKRGTPLAVQRSKPIDGTFPEWPRVIPRGDMKRSPYEFSNQVLETVLQTTYALRGRQKITPITTWATIDESGGSGGSPHTVRYSDKRIFSVIMPIRDLQDPPLPDWFLEAYPKAPKPKRKSAAKSKPKNTAKPAPKKAA